MNKEVFADYPYKPNALGIPFEEIYTRAQNGERMGYIESGSGRTLSYVCELFPESGRLDVVDVAFRYFEMSASIDSASVIRFVINTRGSKVDDDPFSGGYHPDFWARKFVELAFRLFQSHGYHINRIKSEWVEEELAESTNYEMFMREFAETQNRKEAAKKTWSGQVFASLGFGGIDRVYINQKQSIVTTYFSRG